MCVPIASGSPYQGSSRLRAGAVAPKARFARTAAAWTKRGTATASAYHTQFTRQRISRAPTVRSPGTPSVTATTSTAASRAPGAKKLFHGMAPQART